VRRNNDTRRTDNVQPIKVIPERKSQVETRVPISRKLLKRMIKEHYIIKEHSEDDTSISSISIVAKSSRKPRSNNNQQPKIKRKPRRKVDDGSHDGSSIEDFQVLNQRRTYMLFIIESDDTEFKP
jgi:hypothetical protein